MQQSHHPQQNVRFRKRRARGSADADRSAHDAADCAEGPAPDRSQISSMDCFYVYTAPSLNTPRTHQARASYFTVTQMHGSLQWACLRGRSLVYCHVWGRTLCAQRATKTRASSNTLLFTQHINTTIHRIKVASRARFDASRARRYDVLERRRPGTTGFVQRADIELATPPSPSSDVRHLAARATLEGEAGSGTDRPICSASARASSTESSACAAEEEARVELLTRPRKGTECRCRQGGRVPAGRRRTAARPAAGPG